MNRLFAIIALVSCLLGSSASPGLAQDDDSKSSLVGGAWALQFRISDNFTLSSFSGSVLSIKRHFSANSGIRLGVGLSVQSTDQDIGSSRPDTLITTTADLKSQSVSLELQYLFYTTPESRGSLFWGLGPAFAYSNSDMTSTRDVDTVTTDGRHWSLGILASVGFEWFPTRILSLHAEYGLIGSYYSQKSTLVSTVAETTQIRESKGWRIAGDEVLFGLSVYF